MTSTGNRARAWLRRLASTATLLAALGVAPTPATVNTVGIGPFDLIESYRTWAFHNNTGTYDRFRWTVDYGNQYDSTATTSTDARRLR